MGGGLIIVPFLSWLFLKQGFAPEIIIHLAIGTSLATIVPTALSSIWAHHRRGSVRWGLFRQIVPGILLGAFFGAMIADFLPANQLRTVFAVFELLVATQMALQLRPEGIRPLPSNPVQFTAGGIIGIISAIVGVGGGTMTVPWLAWHRVKMQQAVGTSAAVGLPIALSGSLGFLWMGWDSANLPAWSSGYLYWPAFFGIVLSSVFFSPLGAQLAHRLPAVHLKRTFALFLFGLSMWMFFS